ncbi:MAG TPA: 50S ribosomal protein L13 [Candidatus Saccharibacteria bacterium]|jgi:large subunit ribosomal protein L13|nr:50S ribosomal protein L13 [Candidatus Saccharibacteria bacterium]HMT55373.1 50S ribosomal protein L13 [Candidatus Saccharibacteria bacterium]
MKTYSAKPSDVKRVWHVVDASQTTLGRLSTEVAQLLTGKKKPMFTHHVDCGDYVIVVNAENLKVTGQKTTDKKYYHHTGFPGGIKERSLKEQHEIDPTKVIETAVRGMLPVNKLRDGRLKRLKIYAGMEHGHEAQKPVVFEIKKGTN